MRIIFVRHGAPDYKNDTLLEIGKLQAEAVAKRLSGEGISEIYSSTHGRAIATAKPTAELLGLEIKPCEFIRELSWGGNGEEIPYGGHPWYVVDDMVKQGANLDDRNWLESEFFSKNLKLKESIARVERGGDAWLENFGYVREGSYYRVCEGASDKTVAIFSHHGASCTLMSHMVSIPFPRFLKVTSVRFASVCIVELSGKTGELCVPRLILIGDDKHVSYDDIKDDAKK